MQNNDNQTNQNDPHNRGQNGFESISPELCSIWLGMRDSNPRSWDQNPLPYHLANPQWISRTGVIVANFPAFLKVRANPFPTARQIENH